jgi:hypothetical protein
VFRAVHREWWARSRLIEFFARRGRSVIRLTLSRSERRATEQAEVTVSGGWVESGKNIPWSRKLAMWGGEVKYFHVRR